MPDDVYRRALADMPAAPEVWAEAVRFAARGGAAGRDEARMAFAAVRFEGLYAQARGLLEALVAATDPPVASINE